MKWIAKILRGVADKIDPPVQTTQGPASLPIIDTAPAFTSSLGYLNPTSPTWLFIRDWANDRLDKARTTNDSVNCDATKTAVLRGEIKILKDLLALPNLKKGLLNEEAQSY